MSYKNEKHRITFSEAIDKQYKKDYPLMAALYLLISDHQLWKVARRNTERNIINIDNIKLSNCTPTSYILRCVAKDLYLDTGYLTISDFADSSLTPAKLFGLICNVTAIRRFGSGEIAWTKSEVNR